MPKESSQGDSTGQTIQHATCVVVHGNAALITGASGSGKSTLALNMMAFGAKLIADDQVILQRDGDRIMASAPPPISGLIEARGVGILRAAPAAPAPVHVVIDLDQIEQDRLPTPRKTQLMGQAVPLLFKPDTPHFAAALMQYLTLGPLET